MKNQIDFNYDLFCKGGYEARTKDGQLVTGIKKRRTVSEYSLFGVIGGMVDSWRIDGTSAYLDQDTDLVMIKI